MRMSSLELAALAGAATGLRSTVGMAALINAGVPGLPRQLTGHAAQVAASLGVAGELVEHRCQFVMRRGMQRIQQLRTVQGHQGKPALATNKLDGPRRPLGAEVSLKGVFMLEALERPGRRVLVRAGEQKYRLQAIAEAPVQRELTFLQQRELVSRKIHHVGSPDAPRLSELKRSRNNSRADRLPPRYFVPPSGDNASVSARLRLRSSVPRPRRPRKHHATRRHRHGNARLGKVGHDADLKRSTPFLARDHPACGLDAPAIHAGHRKIQDLLSERGLVISYESVHRWVAKFGPLVARKLRGGPPRPTGR